MKDWLVEIVDQIALGEFLANSSISCGQRFGLIAVDNAIEFMLIAYVEIHRRLVGGHKAGGINKKDWDETKRVFPKLLAFVAEQETALQAMEVDINRYHDFRNSLYHSGTPVTTTPSRVNKYSRIAREVMAILFAIRFSPDEWNDILMQLQSALGKSTVTKSIRREVTYQVVDGFLKFTTDASPTAKEAIALCLYGYSANMTTPLSRPILGQSLAKSGHSISTDALNARLYDLKKMGWLQTNNLILSVKGRKQIARKFLLQVKEK